MKQLLVDARWYIRFLSLFGLCAIAFVLTWTLSYYLLPEGILRGRTAAGVIAGSEAARSFWAELARIVALNLFAMVMIVLANWSLKVRGYPLGYLLPLYHSIAYAVILGTNSFSIPLPDRMAPTFQVLTRSGVYEILAYTLMAAATYGISTNRLLRLVPSRSEPIEPKPAFAKNVNWLGFALALAVLVAASAYEAHTIVSL
jgi:hypothetical protein